MPDLPVLLERLGSARAGVFAALDAAPDDSRTRKPAPDVWSPLEVAEHTYRAEARMLEALERQIARGADRKRLGPVSRVKVWVLLAALRSPFRFRAPRVRGLDLEALSWAAIRADWAGFDARWQAVLAHQSNEFGSEGLVRHPYAGPLDLEGALRFLIAHTHRHREQVHERLF